MYNVAGSRLGASTLGNLAVYGQNMGVGASEVVVPGHLAAVPPRGDLHSLGRPTALPWRPGGGAVAALGPAAQGLTTALSRLFGPPAPSARGFQAP